MEVVGLNPTLATNDRLVQLVNGETFGFSQEPDDFHKRTLHSPKERPLIHSGVLKKMVVRIHHLSQIKPIMSGKVS